MSHLFLIVLFISASNLSRIFLLTSRQQVLPRNMAELKACPTPELLQTCHVTATEIDVLVLGTMPLLWDIDTSLTLSKNNHQTFPLPGGAELSVTLQTVVKMKCVQRQSVPQRGHRASAQSPAPPDIWRTLHGHRM